MSEQFLIKLNVRCPRTQQFHLGIYQEGEGKQECSQKTTVQSMHNN